MDLNKIINFIKWQVLARTVNGSITSRVYNGCKYKDELDRDNPFYYVYWQDMHMNILKKYLLGTFGSTNDDYLEFISWMNDNFAKDGFYEINVGDKIINIPIPSKRDYKCFKAEFLDIIMPELVSAVDMPMPFLEGPYEYGDVKIQDNTNVLDLGANYGLFSALASSKGANVFAFEPTPRILNEYLRPLEKKDKRIHVVDKAVIDRPGKSYFAVDDDKTSCNCVVNSSNKGNDLIVVDTTSIDKFVEDAKLDSLGFIKADIEGAERLMLMGAQKTLKNLTPDLAICMYHLLDDKEVLTDLILQANPDYEITYAHKKVYAKSRNRR